MRRLHFRISGPCLVLAILAGCADSSSTDTQADAGPQAAPGGGAETPIPMEVRDLVMTQVVVPDELDHDVLVLALPEPLPPGTTVAPYHMGDRTEAPPVRTLERSAWLFWIDDAPGARFAHPTRFVLVDAETLEITVEDHRWWPMVDGASVFTTDAELADPALRVFARLTQGQFPDKGVKTGRLSVQVDPSLPPSPGLALVINGWAPGEKGKADFEADAQDMHDLLTAAGFDVTYLGPAEHDTPDRDGPNTHESRAEWFEQAASRLRCGDTLVVYVTSHGDIASGDGPLAGLAYADGVWEDRLENWLKKIDPCVNVIVVLDACHAGAFGPRLQKVADVTLTSTGAQYKAYGDLDGPTDPNPEDKGGEFTSGLVQGLAEILADPDRIAKRKEKAATLGGGFWRAVMGEAYARAIELDYAYQQGLSFPQLFPGLPKTHGGCQAPPCEEPPVGCTEEPCESTGGCGWDGTAPACGEPEGTGLAELAHFMELLFGNLEDDAATVCQKWCNMGLEVPSGNTTPHSKGTHSARAEGEVDILRVGSIRMEIGAGMSASIGTGYVPCGSGPFGHTLCLDPNASLGPGTWHAVYQVVDGFIPHESPTSYYQYGFVADSNGVAADNYKASSAYPKDFFDGTDLWLVVDIAPGSEPLLKSSTIVGGAPTAAETDARILILEQAIVAFLPATEVDEDRAGYRVTAFRHGGDWGLQPPHVWSGDVVPPVGSPLLPLTPPLR